MKGRSKILLVDDEIHLRSALAAMLKGNYSVHGVDTGEAALALLQSDPHDIVISDLFLTGMNGIELLKQVRAISPATEVILMTGNASAETAVRAMKEGAFDYLTKPVNMEELRLIIDKVVEKHLLVSENVYLRQQLHDKFEFANIIGTSPAMQQVFTRMRKILVTDSTILILGESGTGKELVAKAIHFNGHRRDRPFVAVNCSAIPESLLESELFGHVKGAFTGAIRDKAGKFEAANHGTIFLDEIGTMPLHLQTKLLRVLQEQEIERIGSNRPVKLDVRIISATNIDLEQEIRNGAFRDDLYYRLNVIPITLPPLRLRGEDILPLSRHFLKKNCQEMKRPLMILTRDAVEALELYHWPGNVRELENVIERTVALTEGSQITVADLPPNVATSYSQRSDFAPRLTQEGIDLVKTLADMERKMIEEALSLSSGVKARAAALLKLNRTTLVEKMRRLGIDSPQESNHHDVTPAASP
ncbi:MAG TPA: sigma-54 dependent transcriptional regulator [Geobacterales bacterium]|nr:sigma-54 dependent transcriptional regulator [Geobacterales bacterium]